MTTLPVLSRTQIRAFDRHAIDTCHVPGVVLMENAGRGAADAIEAVLPRPGARVVIVCGAGNNGGDGFVVGRHLLSRGHNVNVYLAAPSERVTGDARLNRDAYVDLGGPFSELGDGSGEIAFERALEMADVVIDALLGTGIEQAVREPIASYIERINACRALKVSLDLPSGMHTDSGATLGKVVFADHTITFAHLKAGLLTPAGAEHAGQVQVVDIGVPASLVRHPGQVARVLTPEYVSDKLAKRSVATHKYQAGKVAVVGGSPGKTGAALMAAEAALRGGAGLSQIVTWPECVKALELSLKEVMCSSLDPRRLSASADEALERCKAVAIGPGLGLHGDARLVTRQIVLGWEGRKVVDADALSHFAGCPEDLADARGELILTPHSGELARLLGCTSAEIERDRFSAVREACDRTKTVVVLKGPCTIVGFDGELFINVTGNNAMATAGSGDVLAGLLTALSAVMRSEDAALCGVFFHGLAGNLWSVDHDGSDRGLLASELSSRLPRAIQCTRKPSARPPGLQTLPIQLFHTVNHLRSAVPTPV